MPRSDLPPPDLDRVRAVLARSRAAVAREARGSGDLERWVPQPSTLPPDDWGEVEWDEGRWAQPATERDPDTGATTAGRGTGRHRSPPRILTLPSSLSGARVRVSWRAVVALSIVLVCAAVLFASRVAWAEQTSTPQSVPRSGTAGRSVPAAFSSGASGASGSSGASGAATGGSAGSGQAATPTTARQTIVVDVIGQVARPGVVSVEEGARLVDVLGAVGGALPSADLRRLNLARVVTDGEQVFVPLPGENPPVALAPAAGQGGAAAGSSGASGGSGGGSGTAVAVIDLNAASVSALDDLPGVGPVLAQRIADWRSQHGRFTTVDELGEVSGIGEKLLAQLKPRVRV